jgi:hypothetical protein
VNGKKRYQKPCKKINNNHKHEKPELISYMKIVEEIGEVTEVLLSTQITSGNKPSAQKSMFKTNLEKK